LLTTLWVGALIETRHTWHSDIAEAVPWPGRKASLRHAPAAQSAVARSPPWRERSRGL